MQTSELSILLEIVMRSASYPNSTVELAKRRIDAYLASPLVIYVGMDDGTMKQIVAEVK